MINWHGLYGEDDCCSDNTINGSYYICTNEDGDAGDYKCYLQKADGDDIVIYKSDDISDCKYEAAKHYRDAITQEYRRIT